jgi:hypothetical protein
MIGVRVAVENDVATVQWEQSRSAILRSKANEVAFAFPCQTKDIEKYDGRSYSWIKSGRIVYRRTKKKRTLSYQYICAAITWCYQAVNLQSELPAAYTSAAAGNQEVVGAQQDVQRR